MLLPFSTLLETDLSEKNCSGSSHCYQLLQQKSSYTKSHWFSEACDNKHAQFLLSQPQLFCCWWWGFNPVF